MDGILHTRISDVPPKHKSEHGDYECYRRKLVPFGLAKECDISFYEIPPGKAACPYHYHTKNEEAFYIVNGKGILKTPTGEREVSSGDFLFFPANEKGAHKLTNASEMELLTYLDFDTHSEIDVAIYPDSGKIGIWGKNINQVYRVNQQVDYYDGE